VKLNLAYRWSCRLALKTRKLIGDTAYGNAGMPGWMADRKAIEPHVPVWVDSGQRQQLEMMGWC
jgi:hypothetical protein